MVSEERDETSYITSIKQVSLFDFIDILAKKDILSFREVEQNRTRLLETLKPKNFLTEEELAEVRTTLNAFEIPSPKGWAHAIHLHAMRETKENFSSERVYCESCLINLRSTLHIAGLKNEQIERKLTKATSRAHNYQVHACHLR